MNCVCLSVCVCVCVFKTLSLAFALVPFSVSNGWRLIRAITHCQNLQKTVYSVVHYFTTWTFNVLLSLSSSSSSCCMSLFEYIFFLFLRTSSNWIRIVPCCRCADDIGDFIYTFSERTQFVRNWEMKKLCWISVWIQMTRYTYGWICICLYLVIWHSNTCIRTHKHTNTRYRIEWMFLKKKK